jgi:uncharacterized protein
MASPFAYIGVEDIHAATNKAAALGAKVIRGAQEVPGHGWMSVLIDPTGANICPVAEHASLAN